MKMCAAGWQVSKESLFYEMGWDLFTVIQIESETTGTVLVKENDKFVCYTNGVKDTTKNSFITFEGIQYFVSNGVLIDTMNGLVNDPKNPSAWYYCANGAVQKYTGLAEYDGAWFYVADGKLDTNISGYVAYDTGLFYVGLGRIMTEVNGLAQDTATGAWYYLANGQVQNQYTGLAMYDNAWFYVVNGVLASDYTGYVTYDGSTFYVVNGMLK